MDFDQVDKIINNDGKIRGNKSLVQYDYNLRLNELKKLPVDYINSVQYTDFCNFAALKLKWIVRSAKKILETNDEAWKLNLHSRLVSEHKKFNVIAGMAIYTIHTKLHEITINMNNEIEGIKKITVNGNNIDSIDIPTDTNLEDTIEQIISDAEDIEKII